LINPLQTIVDDYREVVGWRAVIAHQNKVVHLSPGAATSEVGCFGRVQVTR